MKGINRDVKMFSVIRRANVKTEVEGDEKSDEAIPHAGRLLLDRTTQLEREVALINKFLKI